MSANMLPTPRDNRGLGWIPDHPDIRDFPFSLSIDGPDAFDASIRKVDPRNDYDAPIYNQGHTSSCTANAINGMYRVMLHKQGLPDADASRLFLYYNERVMLGNPNEDSGAMVRDGLKTLATQGVCNETLWPFDLAQVLARPSDQSYTEALNHEAVNYFRINQNLDEMKACLQAGFNFVFGFSVYDSFMSSGVAQTGMVSLPGTNERQIGGHAVRAVGMDDDVNGGSFIVANSWGAGWGDKGYFYFPYQYATNPDLSSDFWTLRKISG